MTIELMMFPKVKFVIKLTVVALCAVLLPACRERKPDQTIGSPDWDALLKDGASITNGFGSFVLHLTNVADLTISSGRLVACDGFVFAQSPLAGKFPAGKFPVVLAVAQFSNDQRVACAVVQFSSKPASRWNFCGSYGVDSGTGSYLDAKAAALLEKRLQKDPNGYLKIIADMEQRQVNTWSWANLTLDELTGLNQVLFSSGVGDGGYNCFVGYDDHGKPTKLVTDFQILKP
jgi:hypothetical protein